jgi:hypothetical protein
MTEPYYAYREAGLRVDLSSIRGGEIPIEPGSLRWPLASRADQRFLADPSFRDQARRSRKIDDLDFAA